MKTLEQMLTESDLSGSLNLVNKAISENINHSISYTPNNHIIGVKMIGESSLEIETPFERVLYKIEKINNK
jgi:hypothetical protein